MRQLVLAARCRSWVLSSSGSFQACRGSFDGVLGESGPFLQAEWRDPADPAAGRVAHLGVTAGVGGGDRDGGEHHQRVGLGECGDHGPGVGFGHAGTIALSGAGERDVGDCVTGLDYPAVVVIVV